MSEDLNTESQVSEEEISLEEGEEGLETEQAQTQPLTAQQKKMIRQVRGKYNGKEFVEDLPFEVPEEHAEYIQRQLQMARMGQHKAQELSQYDREVMAFMQELQRNPKKALANPNIGVDLKKLAAEILEEEIIQSQKSPEQIEREKLQAELQALKEEREREKETLSKQELERLTEREFERFDNLISNVFETTNLPKTPYVLKKMTEHMIVAVENGINIDPKDVVPLIQNEMLGDIKESLSSMSPEQIEEFLGQEILDRLRKNRVAGAKKPPVPVKSSIKDIGASKSADSKGKKEEPKTMKDFFGF